MSGDECLGFRFRNVLLCWVSLWLAQPALALRNAKDLDDKTFSALGVVLGHRPDNDLHENPGSATLLCNGPQGSVAITAAHVVPEVAGRRNVFLRCADTRECLKEFHNPAYRDRVARVVDSVRLTDIDPNGMAALPPNLLLKQISGDLALVRLDRVLGYARIRLPAEPIPQEVIAKNPVGVVFGFGVSTGVKNDFFKRSGWIRALQYAEENILHTYSQHSTATALCAGDSGSPWLLRGKDGAGYLYGIASFAVALDDRGAPVKKPPCSGEQSAMAFYASVPHRMEWLMKTLSRKDWCGEAAAALVGNAVLED